jgi:hypothetical protein
MQPDARIASIVANWPKAASARRATERLGLRADADFAEIIRQYVEGR